MVIGGFDIMTSSDTLTWTKTVSPISLYAVSYGGGVFVTVGYGVNSGNLISSPDGVTWKAGQLPSVGAGYTNSIVGHAVIFGNRSFVIVSADVVVQSDPF